MWWLDDQQVYVRLGANRYLPPLVVNHHVMWLDVSVHDALRVAVVQSLLSHRVNITFPSSVWQGRAP